MRFVPDHQLHILTDDAFASAISGIEARLEACRNSGFFDAFDGKKIYYEYYLAEGSHASVIIVHGLSEFSRKYYEMATYFLNQGYNVFLFDQRCHGFSDRLTDQIDLIHVDRFSDYVADLERYIDTVVLPTEQKPLYIYSHSMGGAVTALYLAKHPGMIQKAVLLAPLVEPQVGKVSPTAARISIRISVILRGAKKKFPFSQEFKPDHPHRPSAEPSKNRFYHNLNMRRNEPRYRSTPMTLGWIDQALRLKSILLSPSVAGAIQTPMLLLSAERDSVVVNKAQRQFADRCPACHMEVMADTNHSLLTGSLETMTTVITRTLDFYRD